MLLLSQAHLRSVRDWSRKLAPLFQPVKFEAKTDCDLSHAFSRASVSLLVFTSSSHFLLFSFVITTLNLNALIHRKQTRNKSSGIMILVVILSSCNARFSPKNQSSPVGRVRSLSLKVCGKPKRSHRYYQLAMERKPSKRKFKTDWFSST